MFKQKRPKELVEELEEKMTSCFAKTTSHEIKTDYNRVSNSGQHQPLSDDYSRRRLTASTEARLKEAIFEQDSESIVTDRIGRKAENKFTRSKQHEEHQDHNAPAVFVERKNEPGGDFLMYVKPKAQQPAPSPQGPYASICDEVDATELLIRKKLALREESVKQLQKQLQFQNVEKVRLFKQNESLESELKQVEQKQTALQHQLSSQLDILQRQIRTLQRELQVKDFEHQSLNTQVQHLKEAFMSTLSSTKAFIRKQITMNAVDSPKQTEPTLPSKKFSRAKLSGQKQLKTQQVLLKLLKELQKMRGTVNKRVKKIQ